ncbi:MAG: C39 family peptidase [Candidatus Moraniibacteriota bacterium]
MINKRLKNIIKSIFFIIVIFIFTFLNFGKIQASDCEDDCKNYFLSYGKYPNDAKNESTCEKNCEDLEKKAAIYEKMIQLKNKQQGVLADQLNNINNEQIKTLAQLQETQKQVQTLEQQIESISKDIKNKEAMLSYQKIILANLMQAYYDYDQQGVLSIMLTDGNFSDILSQSDYIGQSGTKVSDVLIEITNTKQELINDQNELNQKKEASDEIKLDLLDKKNSLQATENQKTNLLIQTQGEEAKYQQMLAHIETQKSELFNFSSASNIDEVSSSVNSYPKPSKNLASTSWYFSQKDSRWGNTTIGNSRSSMKDWGCAVTSVSMIFRKNGSNIDPGKMAKQKIFSGDLIKWPTAWDPGIKLVSSTSHGNYSKSTIDTQISKGNPVIVHIKKSNGRGGHYVVITGKDNKDYIVHDPYFGANLYLGTSRALVGKLGVDSGTSVDQMIIYNN